MDSVAEWVDQEAMKEAEELKQTLDEIDSIDMDEAVPEEIEEDKALNTRALPPSPSPSLRLMPLHQLD